MGRAPSRRRGGARVRASVGATAGGREAPRPHAGLPERRSAEHSSRPEGRGRDPSKEVARARGRAHPCGLDLGRSARRVGGSCARGLGRGFRRAPVSSPRLRRPPRRLGDRDGRGPAREGPHGRRLQGPSGDVLDRPPNRQGRARRDGEHRLGRRDRHAHRARAPPGRGDGRERRRRRPRGSSPTPLSRPPRASGSRKAPPTSGRPAPPSARRRPSSPPWARGGPRERLPPPRGPLQAAPARRRGRDRRDARRRALHVARRIPHRPALRRGAFGRGEERRDGEGREDGGGLSRGREVGRPADAGRTGTRPGTARPRGVPRGDDEGAPHLPAAASLRVLSFEESLHLFRGVPLQRRRSRVREGPEAPRLREGPRPVGLLLRPAPFGRPHRPRHGRRGPHPEPLRNGPRGPRAVRRDARRAHGPRRLALARAHGRGAPDRAGDRDPRRRDRATPSAPVQGGPRADGRPHGRPVRDDPRRTRRAGLRGRALGVGPVLRGQRADVPPREEGRARDGLRLAARRVRVRPHVPPPPRLRVHAHRVGEDDARDVPVVRRRARHDVPAVQARDADQPRAPAGARLGPARLRGPRRPERRRRPARARPRSRALSREIRFERVTFAYPGGRARAARGRPRPPARVRDGARRAVRRRQVDPRLAPPALHGPDRGPRDRRRNRPARRDARVAARARSAS